MYRLFIIENNQFCLVDHFKRHFKHFITCYSRYDQVDNLNNTFSYNMFQINQNRIHC